MKYENFELENFNRFFIFISVPFRALHLYTGIGISRIRIALVLKMELRKFIFESIFLILSKILLNQVKCFAIISLL